VPIIRIVRSAKLDRDLYRAVSSSIDIEHKHPLGLLMHAAGEVDGRWQIVNVWDDREYAQRFEREIVEPAILEATGGERLELEVTIYEVQHLITP
jgi:hypothetical protein